MLMGTVCAQSQSSLSVSAVILTATDISWVITGGNYFWCMAEFQFFSTPDLTGSTIAGTASVSSVRAGYPSRNASLLNDGATDNTGASSWNSQEGGASPEWAKIVFSNPSIVRSFRFWIPTFDNPYFPKAVRLTRELVRGGALYDDYSTTNTTGAWQNFVTTN